MVTSDDRVGGGAGAGDGDAAGGGGGGVLRIDCAACVLEGTAACDDCVVTFLVDRTPGTPVVVDASEARALRALARAGLAPGLRHRPRQSA